MIEREEYLKAKDVVAEYEKQLNIHLVSDWNDWVYESPTSIIDGSNIDVMRSDGSIHTVFYQYHTKSMAHKLPPIKWRYSNS